MQSELTKKGLIAGNYAIKRRWFVNFVALHWQRAKSPQALLASGN